MAGRSSLKVYFSCKAIESPCPATAIAPASMKPSAHAFCAARSVRTRGLVDHAIAAEMGVSRMPVREALMQLVSARAICDSTSRGFALPDLTPDRIAEVFVLRRLLEPHAVACAARDRTEVQMQACARRWRAPAGGAGCRGLSPRRRGLPQRLAGRGREHRVASRDPALFRAGAVGALCHPARCPGAADTSWTG
jgi:hypothetical protein